MSQSRQPKVVVWWRSRRFDPLRLRTARLFRRRCVQCFSRSISGCWGPMWCHPVAWGCTECRRRYSNIFPWPPKGLDGSLWPTAFAVIGLLVVGVVLSVLVYGWLL